MSVEPSRPKMFERLTDYCRRTGYPIRQLRMAIYTRDQSGIMRSRAVVKIGGRYFVRHRALMRWTAGLKRSDENG